MEITISQLLNNIVQHFKLRRKTSCPKCKNTQSSGTPVLLGSETDLKHTFPELAEKGKNLYIKEFIFVLKSQILPEVQIIILVFIYLYLVFQQLVRIKAVYNTVPSPDCTICVFDLSYRSLKNNTKVRQNSSNRF